jgi:hypothetical protein
MRGVMRGGNKTNRFNSLVDALHNFPGNLMKRGGGAFRSSFSKADLVVLTIEALHIAASKKYIADTV